VITSTKQLQRALAASTALAVAALGATATTAAAAPPHDKARGQSIAQGHGGAAHDKAPGKDQGQGRGPSQGKAQGRSAANGAGQQQSAAAPHGQSTTAHDRAPGQQPASEPADAPAGKPGAGRSGDPAGNNGTVKITPHGEVDGIPQNTPHVGCVFDVEWYGFDEGDDIVSQVTFQSWAPTRVPMTVDGPAEVFVGADPASGAGVGSDADGTDTENGFDGEATYTLSFDGEAHPQQGYHVKLTINTPGSQGADVKHKVFWVQDCEEPETPDTPDTPDTPEVEGEQDVDDDALDTGVEVLGEQATSTVGTQQAGPSAAVPTAVDAGLTTAQVAASTPLRGLLVALLGLLVAGTGLVLRRRA
jgi:hypothetical protein